jgi:hypothetical protein
VINNNAQDRVTRLPLVHASGLSASPSPSKEKPSLLQALGPLSLLLPSLVSTFLIISFAADGGMPSRYRPAKCWRGPRGWLWQARAPASVHDVHAERTSLTPRLAPDSWTSRPSAPTHPVAPPRIRRVRGAPLRYAHVWTDWTLLDVESLTTLYRTGRRQPPRGISRDVSSRVWASRDGNPSDGNPRARSPCKVTEGAQARTLSKARTGKGHVWGRIVRG